MGQSTEREGNGGLLTEREKGWWRGSGVPDGGWSSMTGNQSVLALEPAGQEFQVWPVAHQLRGIASHGLWSHGLQSAHL